jgi:uncharacterized protein YcfL
MGKLISILFACLLVLSGCSSLPPQSKIAADQGLWTSKQKVGIYVGSVPKITTSFPGAGCLLCLASASLANSSLTKQVETYKASQLQKTKENLIAKLKTKDIEVIEVDSLVKESAMKKHPAPPNKHITKDYSIYKTRNNVDQILVVNFSFVGVTRSYSSYIPNGAPLASISAEVYMIDTKTNNYTIFDPINITRGAEGEWDKPPTFPGITNAFYQAEEAAVDQLADTLK